MTTSNSAVIADTNVPAKPKYVKVPVAEAFGIESQAVVRGIGDDTHPLIPKAKPYKFRKEALQETLGFLMQPAGDGLLITGPTGSGKTSLIEQVAARLNWPVINVAAHGRLTFDDLCGLWTIGEGGETQYLYGPLCQAAKHGCILVINEFDHTEPSELAGLHDVLEGKPLVLAAKGGEVIEIHDNFRLVITGNSAGHGDLSGLYAGVLTQNLAFMDRYQILEVDYMHPSDELEVLQSVVGTNIKETVLEKMIEVANHVRRVFKGEDNSGSELSVTLSTRTLVRWARKALNFRKQSNSLAYALDISLLRRAEPAQREIIHRIAKDVFGDDWAE
tara:strand:- start:779 stop:1774 length:996 start_codon:yes stop_codon:yes gene_type:complete